MIHKVINLREKEINGFMPKLTCYIIDDCTNDEGVIVKKRPAVLICPGGGYEYCSKREAEPIALQYMAAGISAFVLDYSVYPNSLYPNPQIDASNAITTIRKNATKWGIDKDKIVICGFSAGGHLAASIATMWDEEPLKTPDEINKPNAAILCYPVISSKKAHEGTFKNLCNDDLELRNKMSLEERVSKKTVPCFLWHTVSDETVPVENSLLFANALQKNKIPFEMHIFPEGIHGLSLATSETATDKEYTNEVASKWMELSIKWLDTMFHMSSL